MQNSISLGIERNESVVTALKRWENWGYGMAIIERLPGRNGRH